MVSAASLGITWEAARLSYPGIGKLSTSGTGSPARLVSACTVAEAAAAGITAAGGRVGPGQHRQDVGRLGGLVCRQHQDPVGEAAASLAETGRWEWCAREKAA